MKKNIYIQPQVEVTTRFCSGMLCISGGTNNDPLGGGVGGD